MPEPLTTTERKVYHYLLDFLAQNTYQPSVRDIGKKFQIKSTKTVSELLQSLANKGYIERDPSRSRGVKLLGFEISRRTQPVPYYGKVAAGEPALVPANRGGFITVDRRFLPGESTFFIKAMGDSMVGRGIFDGDYILVNPSQKAAEGDIIAARVGEEATIKTLAHENGAIVLKAANPAEKDVIVDSREDFSVLGVVCGVFRPFCDNPEVDKDGALPD
jgi:repressor LexA